MNDNANISEQQHTAEQGNASPLSELTSVVSRLEKANEEAKKILEEQKIIAAKNLLGGMTSSGVQAQPVKEETPREYARRLMSGRM